MDEGKQFVATQLKVTVLRVLLIDWIHTALQGIISESIQKSWRKALGVLIHEYTIRTAYF